MKITQNWNRIRLYRSSTVQVPSVGKPPVEKESYKFWVEMTQSEYDELREAIHAHELDRWNRSFKGLLRRKKDETVRAD